MDISELKKHLNKDNIPQIVERLILEQTSIEDLSDIIQEHDDKIIYRTGCHNADWQDGDHKLYFYKESLQFRCYTQCGENFDIIELIEKRWELEDRSFVFVDILNYIQSFICPSNAFYLERQDLSQQTWKSRLESLTSPTNTMVEPQHYNKDVLNVFEPYYHTCFINDGISIEAMKKYNVGYYPCYNQITLPVLDIDNNLVGVHCRNLNESALKKYKYMPFRSVGGNRYNFPTSCGLYGIYQNKDEIRRSKKVLLFEAPKSVLQMSTMFKNTNAVGMFGMNFNKRRRDILLKLGVDEVVICLDKEYNTIHDDKWQMYKKRVLKIANLFKGYCNVSIVCDVADLIKYKDSPSDGGVEVWNKLYDERIRV